jgi:hypothetical protein
MLFMQMPAARPHQQHRCSLVEPVLLAALRIGEIEIAMPAVDQVELAFHHIIPARRIGVFEIGHEHPRPGIECVDDHFAVGRPGDFDPPVEEVGGNGSDRPLSLPHLPCLRQEIRKCSAIEPLLPLGPPLHQLAPPAFESAVETGHELQSLPRQHPFVAGLRLTA